MAFCFIGTGLIGQILGEAKGAYPLEACGLLIGTRDAEGVKVDEAIASANVAEGDRRRRFAVDPELQFRMLRTLRGTGREIVGVYHSHPDGEAAPSLSDAEIAFEADLVWIIVSVEKGERTRLRAHLAKGEVAPLTERFAQLELAIVP